MIDFLFTNPHADLERRESKWALDTLDRRKRLEVKLQNAFGPIVGIERMKIEDIEYLVAQHRL